MENLNIKFENYNTTFIEEMLKANMLPFKKENGKNSTILIFDIETARAIYTFAGHLISNILINLKENEKIYFNDTQIKNDSNFQEFSKNLFNH